MNGSTTSANARARMLSPGAVLAVVNARIDRRYVLPAFVGSVGSLNLDVVIYGPSGTGKCAAMTTATELTGTVEEVWDPEHPSPDDWVRFDWRDTVHVAPLGSGEGLAQSVHEWVDDPTLGPNGRTRTERRFRRVRGSVLLFEPEGHALAAQMCRSGSTTVETLRRRSAARPWATATPNAARRSPCRLPGLRDTALLPDGHGDRNPAQGGHRVPGGGHG